MKNIFYLFLLFLTTSCTINRYMVLIGPEQESQKPTTGFSTPDWLIGEYKAAFLADSYITAQPEKIKVDLTGYDAPILLYSDNSSISVTDSTFTVHVPDIDYCFKKTKSGNINLIVDYDGFQFSPGPLTKISPNTYEH